MIYLLNREPKDHEFLHLLFSDLLYLLKEIDFQRWCGVFCFVCVSLIFSVLYFLLLFVFQREIHTLF